MAKPITVIGSANVDFVMRVPFFPRRGESVNGGPFLQSFGGKGSNQALAARRAGAAVTMVANLGGDAHADALMALYEKEGIDASRCRRNPGQLCGAGIMLVDDNGDNLICTSLEANGRMDPAMVDAAEDAIAASGLLMLQMEVPDAALARAVALAERHHVPVMLNFAPARATSLPVDRAIAILIVNETEAENLTGLPLTDPESGRQAARRLVERGHETVIVTMGAMGCAIWHEGETNVHPAFAVDALDVTAAGDSFCGALAAGLVEGMALDAAVRFACAAGALCVGVVGALPSIPFRRSINLFFDKNPPPT